ncbi:MAG TPA: curli production assembly protein CsgG [Desulfobulbaceae bacterium]|nr:MAG: curli production assembly protein CsgG [Deltaproteobacteria bacterium RIFOXYD12_FULL_53_23]HCC55204.1 curli production assembly protein CsgG [Desulfobulbaceae bacterium]
METKRNIAITAATALLFTGCATVNRPDMQSVAEQPKISKTIEAEKVTIKPVLKRKVAVGRFTNETKYGQSFFLDKNQDRIGKQALDILSNKLNETSRFILLERADLDKIQKELEIAQLGTIKNSADYLIIGSVTEFGRKETGDVGVFSRTKKQLAFAKVHIRLVDVANGQILYSEEGTGEAFSEAGTVMGVGAQAGYDSTINDKALDAAITNLASNIIENLLNKPWKSYVLAKEGSMYLVAGGKSQGIKPGKIFDVVENGKKVNNPQTNVQITLPGKKIAKIRVNSLLGNTLENEVAVCELVSGNLGTDFSNIHVEEVGI